MRRSFSGCCARAASGHPAKPPPRSAMNSRRLMGAYPKAKDHEPIISRCITAESGHSSPVWVIHVGSPRPRRARPMSAPPPRATKHSHRSETPLRAISDRTRCNKKYRYSTTSSAATSSLSGTAEHPGGRDVDDQFELARLHDWQLRQGHEGELGTKTAN